VVVVVVVVVVVLVVELGGGGASELPDVGEGREGGGTDAPAVEGDGGDATIGPTSCTSQLQSQPHSTGSCRPASPRAAVSSETDPRGNFGSFGLFFLLRLLPATAG